jgi:hypothetical protein
MNHKFLLMVKTVERICTFEEYDIFKVHNLAFLPFEVFLQFM